MLHFLNMTITNFGPYKNTQTIDFTSRDGVNIFWGDNGRGKTTLLNAFRYALFGTIQRRNGVLRSLKDIENTEAHDEGSFGFSVVLKMDNDGVIYELTRQYKVRPGITVPKNDEDYTKDLFLKKNGTFLAPNERDHVLNVIMPEQVSRFFLFDGELLQEYEELLENETSTGERIKEAIEKILGVPVLTNGIIDIEEALFNYDKQKSKAAQKDTKTRQLGLSLAAVDASIAEHRNQIEMQKTNLSTLYKEKLGLDDKLSETEQVRDWLKHRELAVKDRTKKQSEVDNVILQLKVTTKESWKGMMISTINSIIEALQVEISTLEQKKQKQLVADRFIDEIKKACSDHRCPVCEQAVPDEYIKILQERITKSVFEYAGLSETEKEQLLGFQARLSTIKKLHAIDKKVEIKMLEDRKASLHIEIGALTQEINDLGSKIAKYGDTAEVGTLAQKYAILLAKIDNIKKGIEEEQKRLDEQLEKKNNITSLINKQASGGDLLEAKTRHGLCEQIYRIFETGISVYREKLKENVEKDATDLFVHLSSDKDYVGLQINDNYGLSIVHNSGRLVPGRSSGFEHIVALSLIGALHKNAPLRGPIIMDSPFGRLDPTHKENIVRALPSMAEQSMLLSYTGEIDDQIARSALGSSLICEYRLVRISSMHTRIE